MVPPLVSYLERRRMCVADVNKKGDVAVARPGGPAILAGMAAGTLILAAGTGQWSLAAAIATVAAACAVGYVDDRRVMPGWFKPALLVAAAVPLIIFGEYGTDMEFPPFGTVSIPVLYLGVILVIIPITGNTINSIDVMNGVASGYMAIAGGAVAAVLAMLGRWEAFGLCIILVGASLAFYRYHRIPSRIFPGDSGALALGAMYGCVAIYGGVEVAAAVALLPAVANSFFFLYSVRRIVEHRQVRFAAGAPRRGHDTTRYPATPRAPNHPGEAHTARGPHERGPGGGPHIQAGRLCGGPGSDNGHNDGMVRIYLFFGGHVGPHHTRGRPCRHGSGAAGFWRAAGQTPCSRRLRPSPWSCFG